MEKAKVESDVIDIGKAKAKVLSMCVLEEGNKIKLELELVLWLEIPK